MHSCKERFSLTTRGQERKKTGWPHVGVVVLHYGKNSSPKERENTEECLEAISGLNYPNFRLIIVDSGSRNGFANEFNTKLSRESPLYPTTYIRLEENLGCAASYNLGANFAIGQEANYVFLLNNDTIVGENSLTQLVSFAEQHPKIGTVGPKVYNYQEKIKSRRLQTIGGRFIGGNFGGWKEDCGQYEKPRPVDFVSGAACLTKTEMVKKIGLFDPRFFIWFEEVDFGVRLRQAGYEAYYYPAEVWHKGSQSLTDRFGPRYAYYSTRNLLYMIRKHPVDWKLRLTPRLITVGGKTLLGALFIDRNPEALASLAKGFKNGLTDPLK